MLILSLSSQVLGVGRSVLSVYVMILHLRKTSNTKEVRIKKQGPASDPKLPTWSMISLTFAYYLGKKLVGIGLPFHGSWMGDSLRAVNWGTSKSLLTCVFSFRDHPPSFSDVLSLESYCFICVASFSLVSGRRIKSGTQLSDWTITDG